MEPEFIKVKKALPGKYKSNKEAFLLSSTEDDKTMNLEAITDFQFLKMKRGDIKTVDKEDIENHLNNRLFGFNRETE